MVTISDDFLDCCQHRYRSSRIHYVIQALARKKAADAVAGMWESPVSSAGTNSGQRAWLGISSTATSDETLHRQHTIMWSWRLEDSESNRSHNRVDRPGGITILHRLDWCSLKINSFAENNRDAITSNEYRFGLAKLFSLCMVTFLCSWFWSYYLRIHHGEAIAPAREEYKTFCIKCSHRLSSHFTAP